MISLNLNPNSADNVGLDVTSVVDQIVASESTLETTWKQQKTSLQQQASILNTLQSNLDTFSSSVNSLKDPLGALSALQVTSSQPSVLTAAAQNGADSGTHVVTVNNLATTSSAYTDAVASGSATLQTGTFTLEVGGNASVVVIDASNNTLDNLAAYLNAQSLGVSASVINDANGARLALVSKTAGAPGDIAITSNTSGLVFHKAVNGVNASLTVDGVPISSASNTVSGAIAGVTLNLASAAPNTEAVLTITADSDKASQAVRKFVDGYNAIIGSLNSQFAVNAVSGTQGILAGNAALRTLQTSLLSNITYAISGNNGLVNLASLGVEMANDGTLSIDDTKFNAALGNQFTDLKNFFQSAGGTGFAQVFSNQLARIGSSVDGIIATGLDENSAVQRMLTDSITQFEDRMAVRRRQLITEYSRIDTMLRQYPLILAQITGQLSGLSQS